MATTEVKDFLYNLGREETNVRWWKIKSDVVPPNPAKYNYGGTQTVFMDNKNVKVAEQSLWIDQGIIVAKIRDESSEAGGDAKAAVPINYDIKVYDHLIDESTDTDYEYKVIGIRKSPSNLYKTVLLKYLP